MLGSLTLVVLVCCFDCWLDSLDVLLVGWLYLLFIICFVIEFCWLIGWTELCFVCG